MTPPRPQRLSSPSQTPRLLLPNDGPTPGSLVGPESTGIHRRLTHEESPAVKRYRAAVAHDAPPAAPPLLEVPNGESLTLEDLDRKLHELAADLAMLTAKESECETKQEEGRQQMIASRVTVAKLKADFIPKMEDQAKVVEDLTTKCIALEDEKSAAEKTLDSMTVQYTKKIKVTEMKGIGGKTDEIFYCHKSAEVSRAKAVVSSEIDNTKMLRIKLKRSNGIRLTLEELEFLCSGVSFKSMRLDQVCAFIELRTSADLEMYIQSDSDAMTLLRILHESALHTNSMFIALWDGKDEAWKLPCGLSPQVKTSNAPMATLLFRLRAYLDLD